MTPTAFHIFQRGWNHQPDTYITIWSSLMVGLIPIQFPLRVPSDNNIIKRKEILHL